MATRFDLQSELARLREDYAEQNGGVPFNHFYCPVLFRDEPTELCAGHVVNQSLPNSCRKWVVQRKDVDGFYGSFAESGFTTALEAKGKSVEELLENKKLRGKVPWKVSVDDRAVEFYEVHGHASPTHPQVHFQGQDGQFLTIALKATADSLPSSATLNVTFGRSFAAEAVASLLKAAHLTMFSFFGYQYVFSAAGQDLARILRDFYLQNLNASRAGQLAAARTYFKRYAGMVIPLGGFDPDHVNGSIEDSRFMICQGSSGRPFTLGVFVRADQHMGIVLLAPDHAEAMDTYMAFTKNLWKERFPYMLADFVPATPTEGAYWKGYKDRFEFDPGPRPSDESLAELFEDKSGVGGGA
jgi:hypothetical protein